MSRVFVFCRINKKLMRLSVDARTSAKQRQSLMFDDSSPIPSKVRKEELYQLQLMLCLFKVLCKSSIGVN